MVRLSERLMTVANMVTPGLRVADVGCDHAHLAIYLTEQGISPFVYAIDVNAGPLEGAERSIEEAGLAGRIETVLGYGLCGINKGDADCIVMAGMGGPLMAEIMRTSKEVCDSAAEFILEPQSEPGMLRHFLEDSGYLIISEDMVCEENKYYPVIKCRHGRMKLDREIYYLYGKVLVKERHPVLLRYLYQKRRILNEIRLKLEEAADSDSVNARRKSIGIELQYIEEALFVMEQESPVEIERIIL